MLLVPTEPTDPRGRPKTSVSVKSLSVSCPALRKSMSSAWRCEACRSSRKRETRDASTLEYQTVNTIRQLVSLEISGSIHFGEYCHITIAQALESNVDLICRSAGDEVVQEMMYPVTEHSDSVR